MASNGTASQTKRDFFVSFNKADRAWATWIAWSLEEAGYAVWFQDWDFRGNFVEHMNRAHREANRTVAVLSDEYFGSKFTLAEWTARFAEDADGREDRLVPVKVGALTDKGILNTLVYADVSDCDEEEAQSRLLERIQKAFDPAHRPKPEQRPPFPPRAIPTKPPFPTPNPTQPPQTPLDKIALKIVSPTVVDEQSIQKTFERFGMNWPKVQIGWPLSADELLASLNNALAQFDKGAANLLGAATFGDGVPGILRLVPEHRRMAEVSVPVMVRRLRELEERQRIIAVSSFLRYANFRVHNDANYHATWQGLRELGIEIPSAWTMLYRDGSDGRLAIVLGTPGDLVDSAVRLVRLNATTIYTQPAGGLGFYIQMPKHLARAALNHEMSQEDFCRWVIPQLEFCAPGTLNLPCVYTASWAFDKISGT